MASKRSPLVQRLINGDLAPTREQREAERDAKNEATRARRPQTLAELREREARGRERTAQAQAEARARQAAQVAASNVRPVPAPIKITGCVPDAGRNCGLGWIKASICAPMSRP